VAEPIEIGVKMRADTSAIPGDVAKAKAQVDAAAADTAAKATEATNKQTAATSALGEKLKQVKKQYGEQIEVVQGLIGKIAAIAGIATIAFTVGQAIKKYIVDLLEDGAEKAKDFSASLNFNDPAKSAEALSEQIQKVEGELAATKEEYDNVKAAGFGGIAELIAGQRKQAQLEETLRELRIRRNINEKAAEVKANKEAAEKKAEEDKKIAEKAANDVASITEQARLDAMTEEQRIVAQAEAKIAELTKAYNAQTKEERIATNQSTEDAIASIRRKAQEEVEKRRQEAADAAAKAAEEERKKEEEWHDELRDWYREQEEAQRKQAEAAAKARDAWVQSLKAIRAEINATFGAETANSITQFGQQIQGLGMATSANMNRIVVEGVG